jgi:excisionase family DNA binding protein
MGAVQAVERQALTVKETAESMGVGVSTIWMWIAQGRMSSFKLGRVRRIRPEDIDAFVERNLLLSEDAR